MRQQHVKEWKQLTVNSAAPGSGPGPVPGWQALSRWAPPPSQLIKHPAQCAWCIGAMPGANWRGGGGHPHRPSMPPCIEHVGCVSTRAAQPLQGRTWCWDRSWPPACTRPGPQSAAPRWSACVLDPSVLRGSRDQEALPYLLLRERGVRECHRSSGGQHKGCGGRPSRRACATQGGAVSTAGPGS